MDMGGASDHARPRALIVDDEKEVADAYALRLRDLCDITTVYSGQDALEAIDDSEVDIVLLDRHMPGMSGDDVLVELDDRSYYGRIIMVTAIDPGFDVLDMPFDDYLCKPIDREDIRASVTQQVEILGYETLGSYFQVASKQQVIAAEIPREERETHESFRDVRDRAKQLEARASRLLDDSSDLLEAFEDVSREGR